MKTNNDRKEITVQSLREASGLTQEEVARRLNCSVRIVGYWDKAIKIPRFDNAAQLAQLYGCSMKTLLSAFGLDTDGIPDDSSTV